MSKMLIKKILALLFFYICFSFSGCTVNMTKPIPQLADSAQDDAIILSVQASGHLNLYDRKRHTLKLALVQAENMSDLQPYLITPEGVSRLLNGQVTAKGSSAKKIYVQTLIIEPSTQQVYKLTRLAGVKKVVVVAGYYNLVPSQVVRTFEVPVFKHWEAKEFWGTNKRMGRVAIFLHLGSKTILSADSETKATPTSALMK